MYGFHETSQYLGDNRQHMPVCTDMIKMVYSWERKVLSMAITHTSLGTVQGTVESSALVAGVPWCPPCLR